VETILTISRGGNRRGVAAPLDMVIFESDEYALPGWYMLSAHKDRLWTLKQCKKYITGSHIARLWYCDDMDAIRDWVARWEFRMTATCTYSNLSMVYAEKMLGKHVNWSTMMAHSRSDIIADTIDIPTDVNWNGGLMQHAITNGLLRQGWAPAVEAPRSPQVHMGMEDRAWDHHFTGGGE
jgi:hypothetical protein